MAKIDMTDEEIELLDIAYTDGERIRSGELFDYQEEALNQIRACNKYLSRRYPNRGLKLISFIPQSKKTDYVEMHFIEENSTTEYTLRCEITENDYNFSDNYYDIPFIAEYDLLIEKLLKDNEIEARVYTIFPYLSSDVILSALDLINHKPVLGRNTELFIAVEEFPQALEADDLASRIQAVFENNGIYSSCMLFFIKDAKDIKAKDAIALDKFVRDRANSKSIYSTVFRCFNVK